MLTIDGSKGEGGGQVLRTSLGLSIVTGKPFRIENIRGRRPNPGLRRQHLTCVQAAKAVGRASASGDKLKSRTVTFRPGQAAAGDYAFDIGTAGSTTLVLQTVLPALLSVEGVSTVKVRGGTHNPKAPPFEFVERAFFGVLRRMGVDCALTLRTPGFAPAGGGSLELRVVPPMEFKPIKLLERGRRRAVRATALTSNLPEGVAKAHLAAIGRALSIPEENRTPKVLSGQPSAGSALIVEIESERITEVFTALGGARVSAEEMAQRVAAGPRAYLRGAAPVGEYLADQLLIPLALAGGGSFRTTAPSLHVVTNIDVIRRFLDVDIDVRRVGDGDVVITVRKRS